MVKAKVLQSDPDNAKLVLSFKAVVEGDTQEAAVAQLDCEVGSVSVSSFFAFYFSFISIHYDFYLNVCICAM